MITISNKNIFKLVLCLTFSGYLHAGKTKDAPFSPKGEAHRLWQANQALIAAATAGDCVGISAALANGAHIDYQDPEGNTPLIKTAMKGHDNAAELLLKNKASTTFCSYVGMDAMSWAITLENNPLIALLHAYGAFTPEDAYALLLQDTKHEDILTIAIQHLDYELAALLLEHGAPRTLPACDKVAQQKMRLKDPQTDSETRRKIQYMLIIFHPDSHSSTPLKQNPFSDEPIDMLSPTIPMTHSTSAMSLSSSSGSSNFHVDY
jgi:hypothetical protein